MQTLPRIMGLSNSIMYETQKGAKYDTFKCQQGDSTSNADSLFTVIITTRTYEDLFRFVTNALKKAFVFYEAIAFTTKSSRLFH